MNLAEARKTFKDVRIAHVGSSLPDGSPHVVPLWFVWLEDGPVISTRAGSRVARNLRSNPRVAIQLDRGRAWTEQAGILMRGLAEPLLPDEPSALRALSAWFEKYREELSGPGFDAYTEQIGQPVLFRVRPDRIATWIHAKRPSG